MHKQMLALEYGLGLLKSIVISTDNTPIFLHMAKAVMFVPSLVYINNGYENGAAPSLK
jgi:hypothetical protein